ncbi:MAG: ATP-binding cassette domain-containing protein [Clostridia bacterium]|nr:ATP-binding cassette domain-containing protein [Clostridia bacterium]
MEQDKRFARASWQIMEELLETDDLGEALSKSLTTILAELRCEVGAIWLLDEKTDRLHPMFYTGPADLSGISVENGAGIEGAVVKSGRSIRIENAEDDPRYEGSVFDDQGLRTVSLICVPLNDLSKVIGCVELINKLDKTPFEREELQLCERMASLAAITIAEKGLTVGEAEDKEILISLQNVVKEFRVPGRVSRILKGINLNVYRGEFLVVLGESGCGKSTMMNIIGGMDYLTDGKLTVEGKDYSHPTDEELTLFRREYIGFIFQSYNLMPNLSAIDNVRFIAEICRDPMPPEEAIAKVGLGEKANRFPSQMSGGQQQRVAIARAIVKRPKLILADEPTAALDYETSIEVLSVIEEIVKNEHTTVIMITHNPEIGKMADRVVKLKNGKVFSIKHNASPLKARELEW